MMVRWGNFFFRYRDLLFPIVFVVLAVGFKPTYLSGSKGLDRLIDVLGVAVAVGGQSLRAAVIGYAYVKRGGKNRKVYADSLVTEGFFNHSRNPLYVGNLMILAGLGIIHGSPWAFAAGAAFYLFAYLAIVAAEENFLHAKFGEEYTAYCQRVPRFLPRFAGLRKSLDGMHFDWRRVVRKEYGSTYAWVLTALALYWWEQYSHFGAAYTRHRMITVIVVLVPMTIAYGVARVLKKTGRLGRD